MLTPTVDTFAQYVFAAKLSQVWLLLSFFGILGLNYYYSLSKFFSLLIVLLTWIQIYACATLTESARQFDSKLSESPNETVQITKVDKQFRRSDGKKAYEIEFRILRNEAKIDRQRIHCDTMQDEIEVGQTIELRSLSDTHYRDEKCLFTNELGAIDFGHYQFAYWAWTVSVLLLLIV